MKNAIFDNCMRIAQDYLPRHPQFRFYAHYSFVIQNNAIIEWATNSGGNPDGPLRPMYDSRVKYLNGRSKTHSEPFAMKRARGLLQRNKEFDLINIRLARNGLTRESAACPCCRHFLTMLGCRSVWFTLDDSRWAKEIL